MNADRALPKLKTEIESAARRPFSLQRVRPGGQDAMVLSALADAAEARPEFLSATLLPGRGMNVLQITAYLPQRAR